MAKFRIGNSKDKIAKASGSTLDVVPNLLGSESGGQKFDSSLIAEKTDIQGDLEFFGSLYFAGKLKGSIHAREGNLELGKESEVHGNIDCQVLDCCGRIFGNIQAYSKSVFRNDCKLIGDISTKNLSIQSGAQISGYCKMLGDKIDIDFFSMPIKNLRKHLTLEK